MPLGVEGNKEEYNTTAWHCAGDVLKFITNVHFSFNIWHSFEYPRENVCEMHLKLPQSQRKNRSIEN